MFRVAGECVRLYLHIQQRTRWDTCRVQRVISTAISIANRRLRPKKKAAKTVCGKHISKQQFENNINDNNNNKKRNRRQNTPTLDADNRMPTLETYSTPSKADGKEGNTTRSGRGEKSSSKSAGGKRSKRMKQPAEDWNTVMGMDPVTLTKVKPAKKKSKVHESPSVSSSLVYSPGKTDPKDTINQGGSSAVAVLATAAAAAEPAALPMAPNLQATEDVTGDQPDEDPNSTGGGGPADGDENVGEMEEEGKLQLPNYNLPPFQFKTMVKVNDYLPSLVFPLNLFGYSQGIPDKASLL